MQQRIIFISMEQIEEIYHYINSVKYENICGIKSANEAESVIFTIGLSGIKEHTPEALNINLFLRGKRTYFDEKYNSNIMIMYWYVCVKLRANIGGRKLV